jgi:TRAP-type C4-dicarboxylate transport system substrate-binding protein
LERRKKMKLEKRKLLSMGFCVFLIILAYSFMVPCEKSAEAAQSIELKYTLHTPAPPKPPARATADQAAVEWFAKEVEARTAGRVKIKFYYGGVLGKPMDFLRMVGGGGVAQIGNIIATYNRWELPLFAGAFLPFLTTSVDIEGRALTKLYNEWAPMREEWTKHNVKPLWWYVVDPYWLAVKKPIKTFDDLKGKKIGAFGGFIDIISKLGITQMSMPAGEIYDALQKGILYGVIFPYSPIKIFKYYEPTGILVDLSFCGGQTPNAQAINLKVWNQISAADRKTIEMISANMHKWFVNYYEENNKFVTEFYKKEGVKFITLSPEEQARIKKVCAEPILDDWIAKCKEKGLPGEEFLRRYRAIVQELSKK